MNTNHNVSFLRDRIDLGYNLTIVVHVAVLPQCPAVVEVAQGYLVKVAVAPGQPYAPNAWEVIVGS